MAAVAFSRLRAGRIVASAKALAVGMIVFQVPFQFGVMPAVERVKLAPPIAQAIRRATAEDVPVAAYAFIEPSLNFYVARPVERLSDEDAVVAWARQPKPGVLVATADALADIQERHGPLSLEQIASKRGLNYSKGDVLDMVAVVRRAGDRDG
jgi:hypothetical protein